MVNRIHLFTVALLLTLVSTAWLTRAAAAKARRKLQGVALGSLVTKPR